MNKASPVDLRKSLEIANHLAHIGIRFVPIPVATEEEFQTLAAELSLRLEQMAVEAEKNEGGATGMSKHMIQHARRSTWMEGKHYRHVAPDMAPKQNSPIMYNRDEINHWIEHQSPAKRRRISA